MQIASSATEAQGRAGAFGKSARQKKPCSSVEKQGLPLQG
jgi:hypothetical protein